MQDNNVNSNSRIVKGLSWKMLERFGVAGIQFVLQIVLARLLTPEHYGILSIMLVFTSLANVFVQTGFNTALIQNKDVTDEDYSSAFWVSSGIALVMYGVIFFSAPVIAQYYGMPDIVVPLRVLALMLFPGAFNSIQLAKLSRGMDFRRVFLSNVGGATIAGIAGVVVAYLGGGLWALVVQNILLYLAACIVMLFTVHWYPRFVCNIKRVAVLFQFGWKMLASGLLDTLYQSLYSLVIGKKYDSGTLGYYNRGKQFPLFFAKAADNANQSVMLSAMSAEQDDKNRIKNMMRTSMTMSAYIMFPMMAGLAAIATPLIELLLSEKWLAAVPYMQICCFSMAFDPVNGCNLQAINAIGRSDLFLKLGIVKKIFGIAVLVIAVSFFNSPLTIAMAELATMWISWLVNAVPNKRLIGYSYKEQILDILPLLFMASVMFVMVLLVGKKCEILGMQSMLQMLIQIVSGVAIYILMSVLLKPRSFLILLDQIRGALGGRRKWK